VAETGWTEEAARDLDETSWRLFDQLTSVELSAGERRRAAKPDRTAPGAERFLAVHWHPERTPLELVRQRLDAAFPQARDCLVIPTPHNQAAVGLTPGSRPTPTTRATA